MWSSDNHFPILSGEIVSVLKSFLNFCFPLFFHGVFRPDMKKDAEDDDRAFSTNEEE
jgi:hypothetical protein